MFKKDKTQTQAEIAVTAHTQEETVSEKSGVERGNILINNLVITMLNLDKSVPDLASKTLKLKVQDHKIILDFFYKHIEATRAGRSTRECRFLNSDATVLKKVQNYGNEKNDTRFINFGNEITKYLFLVMKESKSQSSGSFFILDVVMDGEPVIVLLKLDPKNGVQINLETLDLLEVENMLPETNDRVHKCAIIRSDFVEGETNLFVMDRQQKTGETSAYFLTTFLQARAIPNDSKKTIAVLEEAYEKIAYKLPSIEKDLIDASIDSEFNNGATIHIPQAIENVFEKLIPEGTSDRDILINEYRDEFVNKFKVKYAEYGLHFTVDRDEKKVTYGSKSKQIYIRYDSALDENEITVKRRDNIYTITIENNDKIGFKKIVK